MQKLVALVVSVLMLGVFIAPANARGRRPAYLRVIERNERLVYDVMYGGRHYRYSYWQYGGWYTPSINVVVIKSKHEKKERAQQSGVSCSDGWMYNNTSGTIVVIVDGKDIGTLGPGRKTSLKAFSGRVVTYREEGS